MNEGITPVTSTDRSVLLQKAPCPGTALQCPYTRRATQMLLQCLQCSQARSRLFAQPRVRFAGAGSHRPTVSGARAARAVTAGPRSAEGLSIDAGIHARLHPWHRAAPASSRFLLLWLGLAGQDCAAPASGRPVGQRAIEVAPRPPPTEVLWQM